MKSTQRTLLALAIAPFACGCVVVETERANGERTTTRGIGVTCIQVAEAGESMAVKSTSLGIARSPAGTTFGYSNAVYYFSNEGSRPGAHIVYLVFGTGDQE